LDLKMFITLVDLMNGVIQVEKFKFIYNNYCII
jgi:hypothetical protein